MKKLLSSVILGASVLALAACGGEDEKLVVGASNTPHAVILEKVKPILEEQGIELEIEP